MEVIVFKQITNSETDFSESNRSKMPEISIDINQIPKCNDIIEQTHITKVKHYLVIRIESDENIIAVFVQEIAHGNEEKEKQLEIILGES